MMTLLIVLFSLLPADADLVVAVYDTTPCRPVLGAEVVVGIRPAERTGEDGLVRLSGLAAGTYPVTVEVRGCRMSVEATVAAEAGSAVIVDIGTCRWTSSPGV